MKSPRATLLTAVLLLATTAAAQDAQSTFGHARARTLAELGRLPTAADIVVRDIVNYHHHAVPLPRAGEPVALDLRFDRDAARPGEEVWLQVGYATKSEGDRALAPPCAVALVVDCSGSMQERGKMSQVHRGLAAFVERLRPDDLVALVGFASTANVLTPLRRRGDGAWLQDAIAHLTPEGSTNLHAGLCAGLDELGGGHPARVDIGDRTRRLVLLTDGIANTGVSDPTEIADDVLRRTGAMSRTGGTIDVSTIGLGGDLDTALLQRLADTNRGLFHFVADEQDVQKVFVDEADSLLVPVARSVTIQLQLPPALLDGMAVIGDRLIAPDLLQVALPDLNAGVTGVVMVRCRVGDTPPGPLAASATLRFVAAAAGGMRDVEASAKLRLGAATERDLEVHKNAAIALLADGLAAMARCCDQRRWSAAAAALQRATERAQRQFPGDDADLQRVRDIANGHRDTLRRYVERFRDL